MNSSRGRASLVCNLGKPFQFRNSARELLDKSAGMGLAEDLYELPVVPERAFPAALETLPHRLAVVEEIAEDAAGVVQLIGSGDAKDFRAGPAQMFEMAFLPFQP